MMEHSARECGCGAFTVADSRQLHSPFELGAARVKKALPFFLRALRAVTSPSQS